MSRSYLALLGFVSGATVMASEMAASRLVAPYFGTSTPVFAVLIAFVLSGLALGAALGGRAADARAELPPLLQVLCGASAVLALLPFAAKWLLPTASAALLRGEPLGGAAGLAAFAGLAGLPVLALGAAVPYATRLGLASTGGAGAWTGRMSAASTLGSIAGTIVATFVVLPALGTARTMGLFALALALVAGAALSMRWCVASVVLPAAALALGPAALPHRPGAVDVRESPHALVQVLERADGSRELVLDEAYATQSVYRPGRPVTQEVFAHYLLAPAMTGDPPRRPRALLLGLGAGTAARGLTESYPGASVVGVEVDGTVVDVARERFDLSPEVEVHVADARAFVRSEARRFDVVIVDAFRFPYVPFHLTTEEFHRELRERLAPGGVLCVNVGRYGDERAVVRAVARTLARTFPEVVSVDASNHSNTLLYAGEPGLQARLAARAEVLPAHLRPLARRVSRELEPVVAAEGAVLTDDLAPVEALTDAILLRALWRTRGAL